MAFTGFISGSAIGGVVFLVGGGITSPLGMLAGGLGAMFWAMVAGMALEGRLGAGPLA